MTKMTIIAMMMMITTMTMTKAIRIDIGWQIIIGQISQLRPNAEKIRISQKLEGPCLIGRVTLFQVQVLRV